MLFKFALVVSYVVNFTWLISCRILPDSKTAVWVNEDYGPYIIEWQEMKPCPNTKVSKFYFHSKMETPVSSKPSQHPPDPIFHLNLTILAPLQFPTLKVDAYTTKNGSKILIASKKIVDPCHTPYLNILTSLRQLDTLFLKKANSKECILRKASLVFDLNFSELTRMLLGDQFFYGDYYVRTAMMSRSRVLLCQIIYSSFKKINRN